MPGFTPEHSKPNLRCRTCIFHPVTVRIRTYPFYRHSGPTFKHLRFLFFPFPALPFASIVTIATGRRAPIARHERIWGWFLGKADNRHQRIWGVRRAGPCRPRIFLCFVSYSHFWLCEKGSQAAQLSFAFCSICPPLWSVARAGSLSLPVCSICPRYGARPEWASLSLPCCST